MSDEVLDLLLAWVESLGKPPSSPLTIGICGAQGSGKSTLCTGLAAKLAARGLRTVTLSLDDFYLTKAERRRLAETVHPLLRIRGVPGTHDVELALRVLESLRAGRPTELPQFDKALDDRAADTTLLAGPVDLVLFEGWCIGATPQLETDLAEPINALERQQDVHGIWRRYVNEKLVLRYRCLFARLDRLVFLAAPSFEVIEGWRLEQEDALRTSMSRSGLPTDGLMDLAAVRAFVACYERLTRHMLADLPNRADLVVHLDERRRPLSPANISRLEAVMNFSSGLRHV